MNNHITRHANGQVSTRNSANRIYTHAIEFTWANGQKKNVAWCGSAELAAKQLVTWTNVVARDYKKENPAKWPTISIVEVELI